MTPTAAPSQLKEALEKSGSGWIFGFWGANTDRHLKTLSTNFEEFVAEYERRFGERPDPFHLLDVNPSKGAAFFQVTTLTLSLPMRIMVWRILHGCDIAKVEFRYEHAKDSSLSVTLRTPDLQKEETYLGQDPFDYRALRCFGVSGINDRLVLDGYYAFKKS